MPTRAEAQKILAWVTGILTAVFAYLWIQTQGDIKQLKDDQTDIRINVERILTTLEIQNKKER